MIPVARPFVGEEEIAAVAEVMRSGMLAQGDAVAAFEREFAAFCGAEHGIAVNTGTAALHAALACLGIGPGDEVIVPSFTFIATATAVSMTGATPIACDIEPATFTIDPEAVAENLSPATRAVIGVHLYGHPFDVDALSAICADEGIALVEDCAQAHGATWKGRQVGTFGDAGCFSFYPTKNMTTGEGGLVTTGDAALAGRIRRFINHGQSDKYLHTELGYNYRLTNIGGAIGRVQLGRLPGMNRQRQENAAYLSAHLDVPGLATPKTRPEATHVFHQYVVTLDGEFPLDREAFMAYLADHGIGSAVHYPMPVHMQPLYRGTPHPACPVSDRCARTVLSLPVHPGVSRGDCATICDVINGVE
ncbi:MAG: DegT/DnrJ/EryC1/StrS family aminotransferase [Methanomicrobiales archaeon]|nr:DegT/DnrJ/EryC1/StrS family aminotransferase [Methanomicrobiales archaeon]